ncbi:unnamed protein product [Blepharisma stoltei]|uniref:Uncharacterized protein n=1 Tax=Blepharisma stoltei TaxID=1481888 RepID=A0AAU9JQS3_9CILI|nr:unnamed protein product [Blepharisma stoltei]
MKKLKLKFINYLFSYIYLEEMLITCWDYRRFSNIEAFKLSLMNKITDCITFNRTVLKFLVSALFNRFMIF